MTTAPERAAKYHEDTTVELRATLCKAMTMRTPAHAKAILDGLTRYESDAMTLGTAVHQMLLRDDRIVVCDYPDWRKKEAREQRDRVRALGQVPILRPQYDEAREIAQHVNGQILEHRLLPTPFTKGTAEHVIRFEAGGAACRALLDWLRDDREYIDDLKTTTDASPAKFRRHLFNLGYDIQAAFYIRAVEAAYGVTPTFRWIVVETKPPYPVVIYQLSHRALESAKVKVNAAIQLWNECLRTGEWPAYTTELVEVDLPGWVSDEADDWADVDLEDVPF